MRLFVTHSSIILTDHYGTKHPLTRPDELENYAIKVIFEQMGDIG